MAAAAARSAEAATTTRRRRASQRDGGAGPTAAVGPGSCRSRKQTNATIPAVQSAAVVPAADVLLPTLRHGDKDIPVTAEESTARPGPYWSLMFEVSESAEFKPVNVDTIVEETIQGAISTAMISSADEVVSVYYRRLEHGYPTPCLKRDAVLEEALPMLKKKNIWSRGRFGSYKYEVANQDHSCMIGVECVDNMLFGSKEFTVLYPSLTNEGGKKNTDIQFDTGTNVFGL